MLRELFRRKELRSRLLYLLLVIVILRVGARLTVPFVDTDLLKGAFASNEGFSLLNMFTGGSFENLSIFALSITPYITASIILQLIGIAFPSFGDMQKDGDAGQTKYNQIMKWSTVGLAILESIGLVVSFSRSGFVAGTMFLLWLADLITEKGFGNGISVILMISIVSRIPSDMYSLYTMFVKDKDIVHMIMAIVVILLVIAITLLLVITLDGAERRLPVIHSARNSYGKSVSSIPIKVNIAGVIPVIFASTVLSMPAIIMSFFGKTADWTNYLSQAHWFETGAWKYTIGYAVYAVLILFFAYFYTYTSFSPTEVSMNLKKQGSFIQGIRPGKPTTEYIDANLKPLILIGSLWMLVIVTIPIVCNGLFNASVSFGGTSIIIVAAVAVEIMTQMKSMTAMYTHKGFVS